MKTFEIELKEELVNYVERLNFEVNAKERIVKTMLADTSYEGLIDNDNFMKYENRYEVAFAEYEVAKQEIENLIPEEYKKNHRVSWNLDFATKILKITFECDCFDNVEEIKLTT